MKDLGEGMVTKLVDRKRAFSLKVRSSDSDGKKECPEDKNMEC